MTHASVFSGIGGPEVAAAMLGWENLFHCEINPFGRAVLEYWFPNAKSYEDITTTDFSEWGGKVNVLTGGFPCQPFSYAGQRRGADDDRYLWPYMHRCINQVRPDWVVCENVAGILTMVEQGSVTEMAAEKSLFGEVDTLHRYRLDETFTLERICNDLEGDGYAVQAVVIPACAVNAPHRRDRVFIIGRRTAADSSLMHLNGCQPGDGCDGSRQPQPEFGSGDCTETERGITAHTDRNGLHSRRSSGRIWAQMDGRGVDESLNGFERFGTHGLLPTPLARDHKGGTTAIRRDTGKVRLDALDSCVKFMEEQGLIPTPEPAVDYAAIQTSQVSADGTLSRLNPLFVEEMMGFPTGWLTLPFIRQSGEPNPLKPTATQ